MFRHLIWSSSHLSRTVLKSQSFGFTVCSANQKPMKPLPKSSKLKLARTDTRHGLEHLSSHLMFHNLWLSTTRLMEWSLLSRRNMASVESKSISPHTLSVVSWLKSSPKERTTSLRVKSWWAVSFLGTLEKLLTLELLSSTAVFHQLWHSMPNLMDSLELAEVLNLTFMELSTLTKARVEDSLQLLLKAWITPALWTQPCYQVPLKMVTWNQKLMRKSVIT